jgi:hypothetical protein
MLDKLSDAELKIVLGVASVAPELGPASLASFRQAERDAEFERAGAVVLSKARKPKTAGGAGVGVLGRTCG